MHIRLAGRLEIAAELASFDALCAVIDVIALVKNGLANARDAAPTLRRALAEHIRLHVIAYGDSMIRPKHHWNADIPGQWAKDGVSLDAFIIERAHLRVKRIADLIKNTDTFEFSVLAGLVNYCLEEVSATVSDDGLLGRTAEMPGVEGVVVADRLSYCGMRITAGDVVFRGESAGLVVACLVEDRQLFAMVDVWRHCRVLSLHSAVWDETNCQDVWRVCSLQVSLAWYSIGDRSWVVLRE